MKFKLPHLPYSDDLFFGLITLLLLVVPVAMFMGTYEKFDTVKLVLWLIIAGASALVLVFGRPPAGFEKGKITSHPLLLWLLPLMVVLGVVSSLTGLDHVNSFFGYVPRLNQSVILFVLWSGTVLLFLARLTRPRLEFLVKILVFGGLIASVTAIIQCLGWGIYLAPMLAGTLLQRAPGLLGNPDFSALFLAVLAPLVIWLFTQSITRSAKVYYGLTFLFLVTAVLMLGSRGAWLGLLGEIVVMVLMAAMFKRDKKHLIIVGLSLIISAALWFGLASPSKTGLAGRSLSIKETNVNLRFAVWNIAEQAIMDHPWLGVGPGNFQIYFEGHRTSFLGDQNGVYDDAHNWFLQIGSTVGLPFLLTNLILIFSALIIGFLRVKRQHDFLALSLVSALVGFCVMASFTPLSVGCYFLAAFLLAALLFFDAKEVKLWPVTIFKWFYTFLAAAAIVWGLIFFTSEVLFYHAYVLYFNNQFSRSLDLLNKAIALNPTNRMYYIYRAGNQMRLGGNDSQIAAGVNKFINLHASDADSYSAASTIYFLRYLDISHNRADLEQAIEYLQKSLSIDHKRASRNIQMAVYLFSNNKLDDALNYDIFGLSLDKYSVPGWLLEARLMQMKGNKKATLWALSQASLVALDSDLLKSVYSLEQSQDDIKKILVPVGYQESTLE